MLSNPPPSAATAPGANSLMNVVPPHFPRPWRRRAVPPRGFTLIELLVSMLILTGGLLGVAYLQTWSLQYGLESYHRSQVLSIGNQMLDRMRAMQVDINAGANYTNPVTAADVTTADQDAFDACAANASTARNATICFFQQLADTLPGGTASILAVDEDGDAATNESYQVSVFWSDRGLSQGGDNLDTAAACQAADRTWSGAAGALTWPFNNEPTTDTCLVHYRWSVQVYDSSLLGNQVDGIGG